MINKASVENANAYFVFARHEIGWIKIDNIQFSPWQLYDIHMQGINDVLDKHNVKRIDYTVENVVWDCPNADCTSHWGTVSIKVEKNMAG